MAEERKEKLIRVLQILETTDEKTPMNANDIVEKLQDTYGMGKIDRRSIYRDIRLLQQCDYDICQKSDKKSGWYMDKHVFEDWEIKIMLDAIQQAKCISVSEAKSIKEKLLSLTSKRGRSRFSHMIMPISQNVKDSTSIGTYIETMIEAMYIHRKIRFQYTETDEMMKKVLRKEGKFYELNLYAIYWSENNYYLIGAHDKYDGLTNYRLDRVENLMMSEEIMVMPDKKLGVNPELIIQKYIEDSVDHFSGKTIRIELEYEPGQASNAILHDFAGDKINVRKLKNGKCHASFTKMDSIMLAGWFMQYADRFKVIQPEKLRNEIIDKMTRTIEMYKD